MNAFYVGEEYTINEFKNYYFFLSNFYPSPFLDAIHTKWPTVEHYFQAMKTEDVKEREKIRKAKNCSLAKKLGRKVELRGDWDSIKLEVMNNALSYKFRQNEDLKKLLLETKNARLVEGNYWHDNIWGDCYCKKCKSIHGQNYLGRLLMALRRKL